MHLGLPRSPTLWPIWTLSISHCCWGPRWAPSLRLKARRKSAGEGILLAGGVGPIRINTRATEAGKSQRKAAASRHSTAALRSRHRVSISHCSTMAVPITMASAAANASLQCAPLTSQRTGARSLPNTRGTRQRCRAAQGAFAGPPPAAAPNGRPSGPRPLDHKVALITGANTGCALKRCRQLVIAAPMRLAL